MIPDAFIDMHVHVGEFARLRGDIQALLNQRRRSQDFDMETLFSSPNALAAYLRQQGIARAVILAEDGPGTCFHITTEFVCDFRDGVDAALRDLFYVFGNVNPHRSPDLMAKYRQDRKRGLRGYKLYPADHNFHPISDELMQFYKQLERDGMLLMFHSGTTAQKDGEDAFGDPDLFRPLLEECPELTVIFAHAGKPIFCRQATECAMQYENCYVDTAFIEPSDLLHYLPDLEAMSHKVLFGSDWPAGVRSLSNHIAAFENVGISQEATERILYSNAARLLERT